MMPFGHLPPELSLLWESDDEHQALAPSSVLLGTLFRDWRPATAPARRALRECYQFECNCARCKEEASGSSGYGGTGGIM